MVRLIFLGPPGAGKGTQATLLAKSFSIPHISTGDLLRGAVSEKTDLGLKAQVYMDRGELVPDQLLLGMIQDRLNQPDAKIGWILDGFPRNLSQVAFLDELLIEIHQSCDAVVNIDVPDKVLVTRLLQRGRKDDSEEVIRRRLDVYRTQTEPLIDAYRNRQQLISVNGNQSIDSVTSDLQRLIRPE